MSIVGDWTHYYDYGCSGSYTEAGITFNNDSTFSTSEDDTSETGKWLQNDGMILFQFDSIKTTYGGNLAGNVMLGIMSTFAGLNGCWYAIRVGSTMLAKERKPEFDASGKKENQ